jgi:transcription elongation factor Elf1
MKTIPGVNPDGYSFTALCPACKEKRPVICSRKQVAGDDPVIVACIYCGQAWALSAEEKEKVRREIAFGSAAGA